MSIRKNIFNNGLASILQKLIVALQQLLLVPFFISAWGVEFYGEWLTLSIIPQVLSFSNLGFGTAAANSFVLRYVSEKRIEAFNILKSGILIVSFLIIFVIIISLLFLLILDHLEILDGLVIDSNEAIIALMLIMSARLLSFHQQLFEGIFRAANRAAFSLNLLNILGIITLIGSIIILSLNGNLIHYTLFVFTSTLIFIPIYMVLAWKSADMSYFKEAVILKNDVKDTFKVGLGFLMNPIWQAIYFQGTTFVVRIILGPQSVTLFNTVRALTRSTNQIFSVINVSIFPELQLLIGQRKSLEAAQLFRVSIILTLIVALFGMLFLSLFGLRFYEIWTDNLLSPPSLMWNIIVLGIGFNALWSTSSIVFRATNRPYKFSVTGVFSAMVSVISSSILVYYIGITGAAFGCLLFEVIMAFVLVPSGGRLIGQNFKNIFSDFMKYDIAYFKFTLLRKI